MSKGANRKGFGVCLKVCITELLKTKLSEEQFESIFNYFDTVFFILSKNFDGNITSQNVTQGLQLLYTWQPSSQSKLALPSETEKLPAGKIKYLISHIRLDFLSSSNIIEKSPVIRFLGIPEGQNSPTGGWSEGDDRAMDCSFTTEKLKRYGSSAYSPSCVQLRSSSQRNKEGVLDEIVLMSIKSGLKKVNAYEAISRLKFVSERGIRQLTLDQFLKIITDMNAYKYLPSYSLKSIRQYLNILFKIFDAKSTSILP